MVFLLALFLHATEENLITGCDRFQRLILLSRFFSSHMHVVHVPAYVVCLSALVYKYIMRLAPHPLFFLSLSFQFLLPLLLSHIFCFLYTFFVENNMRKKESANIRLDCVSSYRSVIYLGSPCTLASSSVAIINIISIISITLFFFFIFFRHYPPVDCLFLSFLNATKHLN